MLFKRTIQAVIERLARHFPAVVVTGARQVGKTTLLRSAFPHHTYISLDIPADAAQAEHDPEAFLRRVPTPALIDEVQYAPKLFRHLKVRIDEHRDRKGQFILTGSQKFSLMHEISDSLAGRCGVVELEGMAMAELGARGADLRARDGVEALMHRGSFPELWADLAIPTIDFFRSYLATYLERDVRQILNVTSLRDFDRFLRACAARSGQLLNKTELARDVGVSPKTIGDWLSVAQASNQILLLEPWFGNVTRRLVKSPRLFFADTGLLCFLLGLDLAALRNYSGIGAIWETFVFGELRKLRECEAVEASLWFYRDKDGHEIDFVIDRGGQLTLAEAKWSALPTARDLEIMKVVAPTLQRPIRSQLAIARPSSPFPLPDGRRVVDGTRLDGSDLWGV